MPGQNTKTCARCGSEFIVHYPNNPNTYCSRSCHLAGLHAGNRKDRSIDPIPMVLKTCERCGTEYLAERWNADKRRWCNRVCTDAAHREITGAEHPLYKPKIEMPCEVCGTIKMVKPSLVSRFRACSRRCAAVLGIEAARRNSSLEQAVATELDLVGEPYERQHRFVYYVTDFYLPARNLVIECDGAYWHGRPEQQRLDHSKDSYLKNHGIRIVRLQEDEIRSNASAAVRRALVSNPIQEL